jgi:hypothetical protein
MGGRTFSTSGLGGVWAGRVWAGRVRLGRAGLQLGADVEVEAVGLG